MSDSFHLIVSEVNLYGYIVSRPFEAVHHHRQNMKQGPSWWPGNGKRKELGQEIIGHTCMDLLPPARIFNFPELFKIAQTVGDQDQFISHEGVSYPNHHIFPQRSIAIHNAKYILPIPKPLQRLQSSNMVQNPSPKTLIRAKPLDVLKTSIALKKTRKYSQDTIVQNVSPHSPRQKK